MNFEERWYLCTLEDVGDTADKPEPDWSRVPEDKRAAVRLKWRAEHITKPDPETVKLWGPQIEWFRRQPYYKITIVNE